MPFPKRGSLHLRGPERPGRPSDDDPALVRRTLRGENGAFGLLYERYADRVFRYLYFRVQDRDLAHDLAQDVFLNALKALPQLRHPERFEGWLIRIAHNRVVNHWTRGAGGPDFLSMDASSEVAGDGPERAPSVPPAPSTDDARGVDARLQFEDLLGATLNPTQRQVLALRFAAGLSLRETAEILGCTEDAAKQHQYRALTQLRKQVRPDPPLDSGAGA